MNFLSLRYQEITHFLSADSHSSPETRLEGLRLLKASIIKNKHQLVDLVERTGGDEVLLRGTKQYRNRIHFRFVRSNQLRDYI